MKNRIKENSAIIIVHQTFVYKVVFKALESSIIERGVQIAAPNIVLKLYIVIEITIQTNN